VALQCAIEEHRPVGQRDRRLEGGQRRGGEPQVTVTDDVDRREVAAPHPHPGRAPWGPPARHRDLDGPRGPVQHPVPVGRRRAGHHRFLPGPQPRRADPHLVGEPVTRDQVHRRVQALPRAFPRPPLDRRRRHARVDGLPQGQHAALPADQVMQRHGASIDRHPLRPWPFGETRGGRPGVISVRVT